MSKGGGIEGANANAVVGVEALSTLAPAISVGVLPNATATTASINGNYTLVDITASVATGTISRYDATITLTNGTIAGTYVQNNGGTVTGGFTASGQWSVTNGAVTATGYGSGAVSTDGDLVVLADTNPDDDPSCMTARLPRTATRWCWQAPHHSCEREPKLQGRFLKELATTQAAAANIRFTTSSDH
jgi:hypothetical protein